jgi:hypothetical protein
VQIDFAGGARRGVHGHELTRPGLANL